MWRRWDGVDVRAHTHAVAHLQNSDANCSAAGTYSFRYVTQRSLVTLARKFHPGHVGRWYLPHNHGTTRHTREPHNHGATSHAREAGGTQLSAFVSSCRRACVVRGRGTTGSRAVHRGRRGVQERVEDRPRVPLFVRMLWRSMEAEDG
jgi:hypothetical protein